MRRGTDGISNAIPAIFLVVVCSSLRAQDVAKGALEEIVVTGTRIARPDFQSASPIVSISAERFAETSSGTVDRTLNSLPQFVPSFGSTSNNPANSGQANLSLRGLPTTATLVLLDGRRLMPANGSGVVDVNVVPPILIESVEVVTGGASAVYGSDAVAGVVNLKLRHDFDGVELDATGAMTDRGDGEEYSVGMAAGTDFADGRGSVVGYAGYYNRELVAHADREFSRYGLSYVGQGNGTSGPRRAFLPSGSQTIEEGAARLFTEAEDLDRLHEAFDAVFATYGYAPGTVPFLVETPQGEPDLNNGFGFNDDGSIFTIGMQYPVRGAVANYRGERDPELFNDILYGYNFAQFNALQLPLERTSVFGRGELELSDEATAYVQALYAEYTVSQQLAPTPVMQVVIPVTNPWIPPDLRTLLEARTTASAPFSWAKRMSGLGKRVSENAYEFLQVTLGLHGDLFAGWRYEAYVQAGRNEDEEMQTDNVRRSRYLDLLNAADGGEAICGGYNPFGNEAISEACAEYVRFDSTNHTKVDQRIAEASVSGPVLGLPAGELRVVIGAMYKDDKFQYRADPILKLFPGGKSEVLGFNPADDIDGEDHNFDVYVEASLPLLADAPFAKSLEAVLGYRVSDYASAGNVEAYKAELLYRPVSPIRLRGSYQRAVRAPSIFELYSPQLGPSVFVAFRFDPCDVLSSQRSGPNGAQVSELCVAQGIPANLIDEYQFFGEGFEGRAGGNPDLDTETADTYTVGMVVSSWSNQHWLERLQVSLDWYRIEITGAIETVDATAFISRCYDAHFNPTFAPANTYCTFFDRDPATGDIREALEIYRNIGFLQTTGLDLQFDWSLDAGPGTFNINWLVAFVDSFESSDGPGLAAIDAAGRAGGSVGGALPEWKWNLRAGYAWSGFDASIEWRYVDAMGIVDPSYDWRIPSRSYYDATLGYAFEDGTLAGLSLMAGVENLTDTKPPVFPLYVQANTDPSQYDVLGRRYFLRANYRF